MSNYIHKRHNVNILLYHLVCPVKYKRKVITVGVEKLLKAVCLGIERRYEIKFLEIGMESDHVHFLVQSVPTYSPKKIVQTIKSISARKILEIRTEVKEMLWGGEFWSKGYFVSTVSKHGNEETISRYIKSQGTEKEYNCLYKQLTLWD